MHFKRIITAVLALPILILFLLKGNVLLFTLLIGAVSLLSLFEYYRIVFNKTGKPKSETILFLGYFISIVIIWAAFHKCFEVIFYAITLNLILVGFLSIVSYEHDSSITDTAFKQIQGIIYIPMLLTSLVFIRNSDNGVAWIFLLLILVFSNDTGAFYSGTFLGKRKLCPAVSPGKTIEGALGGLVICVIAGLLFRHYFLSYIPLGLSILFFICIGIVGPAGDLFESILKRTGEIKDSGTILPGHGGILDRIDALIFSAPVAYIFKEYIL